MVVKAHQGAIQPMAVRRQQTDRKTLLLKVRIIKALGKSCRLIQEAAASDVTSIMSR